MNPTNGKTDKRLHARTKKSHEEMQSNWDRIFGKKDRSPGLDKEGKQNRRFMKPQAQKLRAIIQARCIRKYAKKLKVSVENGFDKWISSGNAEKWADNYDKGENDDK